MYCKKHIYALLFALMALPFVLGSCKTDDDDATEASDVCYISKFSLGSLKRIIYGQTTAGMDSIYTTSFSGDRGYCRGKVPVFVATEKSCRKGALC